ncbi:MAG TPA: DUF3617 family protein [Alphaproteobacteria bacterium]|nr:DUF3617 family protein [Alphaproteobacteria bacterium]
MRVLTAALLCAAVLPAAALAEQIDLKTGGWEIVNVMPDGQIGPTQKECLSAEDLHNMRMFLPPESEANCTLEGQSQTKTTLELKEICSGARASTLTISIKADNPKKFVAILTASANGTTQKAQIRARWIQDGCEGFSD